MNHACSFFVLRNFLVWRNRAVLRNRAVWRCLAVAGIILCWLSATAADDTFFEKQVRPLLVKHCYACHNSVKSNGGLALDSRAGRQAGGESGPLWVAGKPDESLLIEAVRFESLEMPPAGEGERLNEAEIATFSQWIEAGAQDVPDEIAKLGGMSEQQARQWWAFQPLPTLDTELSSSAIDQLIDAKLRERSLSPAATADRRTLIRRATYDLTGLPPTPEQVERFVADSSEAAFANLVDRLLALPQYGERWGRHWLDVVRYADTAGENTDRPLPHAWRYRNWVIEAFNRDLAFDEFVRLQLAGDLVRREQPPAAFREGVIATGYLAIARRFGHDIDQDIHLMYEDVIDNVGKNFLGLSVGCARCHDHKYDPLTAADYYALYGIFQSTRFAFPGCEAKGQPRDLVPMLAAPEIEALKAGWRERNAAAEAKRQDRQVAVARLSHEIKEATASHTQVLAEAVVPQAGSVAFPAADDPFPVRLTVRKGEVLQLVVGPNGNHGADSTLVEWEIVQRGDGGSKWNVNEVIPRLLIGNPLPSHDGARWCFLDVTDGPQFFRDSKDALEGRGELNSWSLNDLPSVFVNRSEHAVDVWTSLPKQSFFVHPGVERPVAVAWVSPIDGEIDVVGRVADAHPQGGNGVTFRLEHLAAPRIGPALVELGTLVNSADVAIEPEPQFPVAYGVVDAEPTNARLHIRGDAEKLGEQVPRRWLSVFGGQAVAAEAGSGRQQLADWIVDHPLAARVMVNRIWGWHFGRGLVATPNDFGARGEAPSHPQLLDALAAQFRRSGYSVKCMHRLIMNSQAYQRGSALSEAAWERDADNRYLSRFVRRRLDAEEIRDSLLVVAGQLDLTPGREHPFPPEASWTFTQHNPFTAVYETNRRSVYLMVARQQRDPYLAVFDGADPNASTAVRQTTTVPAQALYFMNAPAVHAQAVAVANRVLPYADDRQRVEQAFRLLFQRLPSDAEFAQATAFLSQYPGSVADKWSAYARVLLASNEFIYLD